MHDRDDVGDLPHEGHVMLDHDQGVGLLQILEMVTGLLDLGLGHAGHRFVEQQQPRVLHQHHADLEPLGFTMRQDPRFGFEPIREARDGRHLVELLREARRVKTKDILQWIGAATVGDLQILPNAEVPEHRGHLEFAADAPTCDLMLAEPGDIFIAEQDLPRGRLFAAR